MATGITAVGDLNLQSENVGKAMFEGSGIRIFVTSTMSFVAMCALLGLAYIETRFKDLLRQGFRVRSADKCSGMTGRKLAITYQSFDGLRQFQ